MFCLRKIKFDYMIKQTAERVNKSIITLDLQLKLAIIQSKKYVGFYFFQCRGNYIQQFGFTKEGINYLYPEEVCILLEKNAVEITNIDGNPFIQVRIDNIIE